MGKFSEKFMDRILNIYFSKDKTNLIILCIFILGLILRFIAARNIGVFADDMHFSVHAINFLHSGKLVVYDQSSSLWYYLTDVFYNIFGTTQIASRMAAVLFGSFSIILIFLLTKEFFSKKTAVIAAFLFAVSPFHIKNMMAEMDAMTLFFILGSLLFLIYGMKIGKKGFFAFSGIFLGLAILTKVYALLFIPVIICYYIYMNYNKLKSGRGRIIKPLLMFLLFAFIFCVPALTHNYLLYKDKGFMDMLFTNTLGIGKEKAAEFYSWDGNFGAKADFLGFFLGHSEQLSGSNLPSSIYCFDFLLFNDFIVAIFGVIGLVYCFFKKREFFVLSLLIFAFVFFYLASRIILSKHYLFLLIVFVPAAAVIISKIDDFIKKNLKTFRLRYLLILILIFNLILLGFSTMATASQFYSESAVGQMMDYEGANIPKESFVVADSRIYRGQIFWMFNNYKYSVESSYLSSLLDLSKKEGSEVPVDVYYVECVPDDCGWGTISSQPEFNASMEDITQSFEQHSVLKDDIYTTSDNKYFPFISKNGKDYFRVYKTTLSLNPAVLSGIKSTKVWFMYPIGWDESIQPIFDKYQVHNVFDSALDTLAHWIVYASIALSFICIMVVLYYFLIQDEN